MLERRRHGRLSAVSVLTGAARCRYFSKRQVSTREVGGLADAERQKQIDASRPAGVIDDGRRCIVEVALGPIGSVVAGPGRMVLPPMAMVASAPSLVAVGQCRRRCNTAGHRSNGNRHRDLTNLRARIVGLHGDSQFRERFPVVSGFLSLLGRLVTCRRASCRARAFEPRRRPPSSVCLTCRRREPERRE